MYRRLGIDKLRALLDRHTGWEWNRLRQSTVTHAQIGCTSNCSEPTARTVVAPLRARRTRRSGPETEPAAERDPCGKQQHRGHTADNAPQVGKMCRAPAGPVSHPVPTSRHQGRLAAQSRRPPVNATRANVGMGGGIGGDTCRSDGANTLSESGGGVFFARDRRRRMVAGPTPVWTVLLRRNLA